MFKIRYLYIDKLEPCDVYNQNQLFQFSSLHNKELLAQDKAKSYFNTHQIFLILNKELTIRMLYI